MPSGAQAQLCSRVGARQGRAQVPGSSARQHPEGSAPGVQPHRSTELPGPAVAPHVAARRAGRRSAEEFITELLEGI